MMQVDHPEVTVVEIESQTPGAVLCDLNLLGRVYFWSGCFGVVVLDSWLQFGQFEQFE